MTKTPECCEVVKVTDIRRFIKFWNQCGIQSPIYFSLSLYFLLARTQHILLTLKSRCCILRERIMKSAENWGSHLLTQRRNEEIALHSLPSISSFNILYLNDSKVRSVFGAHYIYWQINFLTDLMSLRVSAYLFQGLKA